MSRKLLKICGIFLIVSSGWLFAPLHQTGQRALATTNATYTAEPPFLPGSVPPLVMLVMARDHKLYYEAYNDASDLDEDGVLDVGYDPSIDYYGYFDCYKCYTYDSADNRFEPSAVTVDKTCSGATDWSGDYLNYLTMSRIDCLRKVLYGGYRSTDTATETVLERSYIPQDSHTWGKEYKSVADDGYDIADYTPLSEPTSGRHLFASVSLSSSGDPLLRVLQNRSERIWDWVAQETYQAHGVGSPTDYVVRIQVGVSGLLEDNCKQYTSGVYKPVGLLQRYGESDLMYFGLLSGSYEHNTRGGVLRNEILSISDEIDASTGQIQSGGIIDTIDRLRISGYSHSSHSHDCGGIFNRPMNDGECRMWGNPIAEMMYETLRYFSGAGSATSDFTYSGSTPDDDLGLPLATWDDPYAAGNYPYCSKAFMLVFSDTSPSYDTDQLPGTASEFGSTFTGTLGTLDVETLADTISTAEGISGSYFIGRNGSEYDGSCEAKTISGLGDIRGLCPEEPTKQGGYYSASVAYYGLTNDLHSTAEEDQTVRTYTVALASPLPKIEIPVGTNTVSLVPFAKSAFYSGIPDSTEGGFQPTNQIAEFFVKSLTDTTGEFRISFEDAEQGNDFDMDALVIYKYEVQNALGTPVADPANGTQVEITLDSDYAAGGVEAHLGYHISGTTADGTYIDVLDADTNLGNYDEYWLDTDRLKNADDDESDDDSKWLSVRTFSPSGSPAATLIENPLWYAAKWGGFEDKDDDGTPNQQDEWDADSDGVPDTYFYVQNPLQLETQLGEAFASILERMSSGTAAAVVADSQSGTGGVYQAIFYPRLTDLNGKEVSWIGNVKALWLDTYGNIREDTDGDGVMDMASDKIIRFYFDENNSRTRVKTYTDTDSDGDADSGSETIVEVGDILPIWDAGESLAERDLTLSPRDIETWVDTNGDGVVDSGEFIAFDATNASTLRPYLAQTTDTEAETLIDYIHGEEQTGYRSRTIDVNGTDRVWRLGDIVYSTPTVVGKPKERYDIIYGDNSYAGFKQQYKDRRQVIYVGANDGMLHAFNGGFYDETAYTFTDTTGYALGEELWAYVPYNVLPHLQWLGLEDYTHVYYVDLKPKVIDAQIFADDATHPDGWGTVLIGGMRFGGGEIGLTDDFGSGSETRTFRSAFFAIDITDPLNPDLMWEFTDANLGFTTSYPAIVYTDQTNEECWVAFGSGPTDYDGTSGQLGRTYVVKLSSGQEPMGGSPIATNWGGGNNSFMGDPSSVDIDIAGSQCSGGSCSYKPDVFYIGDSLGTLWRIGCIGVNWAGNQSALLSLGSTKPIVAGPSIAEDDDGRLWVYFGTGKLFAESDQLNTDAQSLVGVKEPLDWSDCDGDSITDELTIDCGSCLSGTTVLSTNLLDTTDYTVFEGGSVDTDADPTNGTETTFWSLENEIGQYGSGDSDYDGWIINMSGGERCVTKPTVLGGLVTFSTYLPDVADICKHEGDSYLSAIYYKTGTASYESVIGTDDTVTITEGGETKEKIKRRTSLGYGVASSPSLHVGKRKGAKVIIQTSTGEIVEVDQESLPGAYKSRPLHWVETQN